MINAQVLYANGTQINKVQFSEIEDYISDLGLNTNIVFDLICDEKEYAYVSCGFINGLKSETTPGEWHHYFVKVDGNFEARKLNFN
ncbi:MAG: hypothetical protein P4L31_07320 [Candidatus Babeliales bacterium]|nr:hypothetical protein [Candidatus Babeliales bacterium]